MFNHLRLFSLHHFLGDTSSLFIVISLKEVINMQEKEVNTQIHSNILVVVEEIKEYLDIHYQIKATQQDIIENAIIALQADLRSFRL